MLLKTIYKAQSKKQKGVIIQGILADSAFKKSKEWLRKYLAGVYPTDEKVEALGRKVLTKIGVSTPSLLPFRLDEKDVEKCEYADDSQISIHPLYNRFYDENRTIFIIGLASFSVSETGLLWMKFGRNCTKDLHKINPFRLITALTKTLENEPFFEVNLELKTIYEAFLDNESYTEYLIAWEQFSQKSRYVYALNPFRAICAILKSF